VQSQRGKRPTPGEIPNRVDFADNGEQYEQEDDRKHRRRTRPDIKIRRRFRASDQSPFGLACTEVSHPGKIHEPGLGVSS